MLSHFTPIMSRLGLAGIETPGKTKSPWGVLKLFYLLVQDYSKIQYIIIIETIWKTLL